VGGVDLNQSTIQYGSTGIGFMFLGETFPMTHTCMVLMHSRTNHTYLEALSKIALLY